MIDEISAMIERQKENWAVKQLDFDYLRGEQNDDLHRGRQNDGNQNASLASNNSNDLVLNESACAMDGMVQAAQGAQK